MQVAVVAVQVVERSVDEVGAVVVAVAGVRMVQAAGDEVVDVVAVRDLRVPAARVVLRRALHGGAGGGAPAAHLEDVLGDAGRAG